MDYLKYYTLKFNESFIITLILLSLLCFTFLKYFKRNDKKLPPGPKGYPILGYLNCAKPASYKILNELGKKYGDIIGFYFGQQYVVVLNEFNVMKETLCHPSTLDREPSTFGALPAGFSSLNGEEWMEQRKFCLQSMRNIGLGKKTQETVSLQCVQEFIQNIRKSQGSPFFMTEVLHQSIISSMMLLLFGRKLDNIRDKDKFQLIKKIENFINSGTKIFNIALAIPGYHIILKCLNYFTNGSNEVIFAFTSFLREEIKKSRSVEGYQKDVGFVDLYDKKMQSLKLDNSKHAFNDTNLLGNLATLFLGSSDTTSVSVKWIVRLMAKYQSVQNKVHEELDNAIDKGETLSYNERHKIPYTLAVILEAQRFSSIAKLIAPRKAKYDFEINGYTIPKGSMIITNLWSLHNDSKYWKSPKLFQPERFLKDGKIIENLPSFAPFSFGKRKCPGDTVALNMIFLYFIKIMQEFKITAPPGIEVKFETLDGFIEDLIPQELCFYKRN